MPRYLLYPCFSFPLLYLFCFTFVSVFSPGYRSVPAHRCTCCSHSTVLDCGGAGCPSRKAKYVYLCSAEYRLLLHDVIVCHRVHTWKCGGEWLTLCRQKPGPPPRVLEITNIPPISCDVALPGHLWLFCTRVKDSFWGLAALNFTATC